MPEEQAAQAVSDATESADTESDDSSSDDTQAAAEQKQERLSLRRLLREDPDINAEFQRELNRALRRRDRAQTRTTAAEVAAAGDKDAALRVVQQVANQTDDDDDDDAGSQSPAWLAKQARVAPFLERLLRVDEQGNSHNPYYVQLYKADGGTEIDRRYNEDPEKFYDWLDDKIADMRAEEKLRKNAPSLVDAVATDKANQQLRRAPNALSGGAGAGSGLTVEQYERMSFEDRQELRKKNPALIDQMVSRLG